MPQKVSPRDVFMHILAIVTLYVCAGSFLTLTFQIINASFPDPLDYYIPGGAIRWAISSLVVIFSVFRWASRFLYRDIQINPEKTELPIRKWLLYFTLFAAGGFIISDLVALIYNFLEGDLTARFLFKVAAVLFVAGAIIVIDVVVVMVTTRFLLTGSLFKQRALRFDGERISHLQILQNQIVNYWIQKGRLPETLEDLSDLFPVLPPRK